MKNLCLKRLIVLTIVSAFIFGCNENNDEIKNETSNKKVTSFLKSFYSNDYKLGNNSKPLIKNSSGYQLRTTEIEKYTITEVFVGNDSKARGYLFKNIETNEFESFVDIDRSEFKLTSVDLETYAVELRNAINQMPEYSLTDEFDIIKLITDPINGNPQIVPLGWHYEWGACGNGVRGQYKAYYIAGIRLTKWTRSLDADGKQIKETC